MRPSIRLWLLIAPVIALPLLYVSLASAAFAYFRYDGLAIGWVDAAWPPRWSRISAAQSDRSFALAHRFARRGQFSEARFYGQHGLRKNPRHQEGRLLVAHLYASANSPAAEEILLQGLEFHRTSERYLARTFSFLLQRQQDSRVIALADSLLSDSATASPVRHLAAHAAATAHFLRGNYDSAEDLLGRIAGLSSSREGRLLQAKVDWERGFRSLALMQLRALARSNPADPVAHAELMQRLRQAELRDEARRTALAFQIAYPNSPAARLDLLRSYHDARDRVRVERECDAYVADFAHDAAALLSLADFAVRTGNVALARRLAATAERAGQPTEAHTFLILEAMIVAQDYAGASAAIDKLADESASEPQQFQSLLDSLRAVAALGLRDAETSRLYLANFLQQPGLRAENLLALADRFVALEAGEAARAVLLRATAANPLNQAALTRLVELDLNLNRIDELPPHLNRLLAMRKPSPDLLRVAQHKLGSDLFLFSSERGPTLDAIAAALDRQRGHSARVTAQASAAR